MNFKFSDILVPGGNFDDSDSVCYVSIFMSNTNRPNIWEVGTIFFKNYYVVYDMTAYNTRGEDMLLMGIAPRASDDIILKE